MQPSTFQLIKRGGTAKGDVLSTAQLAGIMAAKQTSNLIPLCHPILIGDIKVEFSLDEAGHAVEITATVKSVGKTGVEMEALTATAVTALTIYDMCKAVDRGIKIENSGLYAFQYVYPKRQGAYFLTHPDSRLNQTILRSEHGPHNEYLQVLIDQGAVGLGLMIWMLAELALNRGWRRRKELSGPARLLHEAFGWSALSLLPCTPWWIFPITFRSLPCRGFFAWPPGAPAARGRRGKRRGSQTNRSLPAAPADPRPISVWSRSSGSWWPSCCWR